MTESLRQPFAGRRGTMMVNDQLELLVWQVFGNGGRKIWPERTSPSIVTLRAYFAELQMSVGASKIPN
jgi:hypothetical protein